MKRGRSKPTIVWEEHPGDVFIKKGPLCFVLNKVTSIEVDKVYEINTIKLKFISECFIHEKGTVLTANLIGEYTRSQIDKELIGHMFKGEKIIGVESKCIETQNNSMIGVLFKHHKPYLTLSGFSLLPQEPHIVPIESTIVFSETNRSNDKKEAHEKRKV